MQSISRRITADQNVEGGNLGGKELCLLLFFSCTVTTDYDTGNRRLRISAFESRCLAMIDLYEAHHWEGRERASNHLS